MIEVIHFRSVKMGDTDQAQPLVLPPDVSYDEKKMVLHKLDSLSLLLYTFLLTLTVVTIWLFKHRSGPHTVSQETVPSTNGFIFLGESPSYTRRDWPLSTV